MKRIITFGWILAFCTFHTPAVIVGPSDLPGTIAYCTHGTPGYTQTGPLTWAGLGSSALDRYLNEINLVVNDQFGGLVLGRWNFSLGASTVTGNLQVNDYYPFDDPACIHGCYINMTIPDLANLPAGQQFQWVQFYSEYGDSRAHPPYLDVIDPPRNSIVDGNIEDDLPFYWNANDSEWGTAYFGDPPSDEFPDATRHAGMVDFVTLLTSWDGSYSSLNPFSETVNVYGAVHWSYSYSCTPDPGASAMLLALGLAVLLAALRGRHLMEKART